ncbi:hypothetical protein RchiOBHm_Chr5g0029461 [Rosa chinensis]|uniref:Uncharacterized protein n=1 Tax=Rosa chinensis TaxID=74649 RepID=A0A2P6Q9Q6_ROSCH|nr:hypothetical protein RchiOBHm_Chr5g0029461 [Rosa chinensis]
MWATATFVLPRAEGNVEIGVVGVHISHVQTQSVAGGLARGTPHMISATIEGLACWLMSSLTFHGGQWFSVLVRLLVVRMAATAVWLTRSTSS